MKVTIELAEPLPHGFKGLLTDAGSAVVNNHLVQGSLMRAGITELHLMDCALNGQDWIANGNTGWVGLSIGGFNGDHVIHFRQQTDQGTDAEAIARAWLARR